GIGPGMGQKLAVIAAQEGAKLAICARTASKLEDAAREIAALVPSCEVLQVQTDVSDAGAAKSFMQAVADRFGRFDLLINSAYTTGAYQLAAEADMGDWRRTMDVNLYGSMNMIQAVVPYMRGQGGGSI